MKNYFLKKMKTEIYEKELEETNLMNLLWFLRIKIGRSRQIIYSENNLRNAEKSGKRYFHNGGELFWAQNWCEHGSVTKKFKNPADYFTEAVDVANKWDLKTILKRGQIIPHVANTYTFTQIEDAIQAGGRYQKDKFFSIHCSWEGDKSI